jgi:hypothetical protein
MNKICTKLIQLVTSLLFITLLLGCHSEETSRLNTCEKQCLTMENQNLKVTVNTQYILVEQSYQLSITSDQKISSIFITGINMNMGKLPLIAQQIKQENGQYFYQASFLLGLCSDPQMLWQLTINTEHSTNQFEFTSYWKQPE